MSVEKLREEALRWFETAREDLEAARALEQAAKSSHACFLAQQSGEKSVKAAWIVQGGDPWGHSIQKLIEGAREFGLEDQLLPLREDGTFLDRFYVPTRYPNGLPDLTPGQCYFAEDARACIEAAERIVGCVERILGLQREQPASREEQVPEG